MIFPPHGILFLVIFMNNIPVFTGQGGTATLILREIPVSQRAYILLRTVLPGMEEPPHAMRLGDDEKDYYLRAGERA